MKSLHILHLPKWYPNADDPQLGIFVQKQIRAVSPYCKQSVLYIKSEENLEEKYRIEENFVNNILEIRISYRKSQSRSKQFIQLNKMYDLGMKKVESVAGIPSILHVHNLITPAIWANKYAKKNSIPWILSEHWSGFTQNSGLFKSKMKWERKLWQWYSEKAAYVISVSEFLKSSLLANKIGIKHLVISNVVEGEYQPNSTQKSEIRMLIVGDMIDEVKNISGAIRAFAKLNNKVENLCLWVVGGGEDYTKMQDLAKELKVESKVKFFGRLRNEEVLEIYNQVDFTLVNSRVETFSVVAAESLMAGKPVISTRCGGVEEFMDETKGFQIAIDNENELMESLEKMIISYKNFDPIYLSEFAQNKFSSKAVGLALVELYQSIVQ